MNERYLEAVETLTELFNLFNGQLFNNEVEKPIITISPDTTSGAYGWCTTQKIWKADDKEYYEINICAEHLNRPIKEVCATLIHEMVHLDNLGKGIKDTSANGRYHNKKFKETAEAHGLIIEKQGNIGWSKTSLQESTEKWIEKNIKITGFGIARVKREKRASATSKSKYKYYMCPCCHVKFYTVATINGTCDDCGKSFVRYK